jgi:hypothetical protein
LFGHEVLRRCGSIIIVFLVEVGERFTEILDLEVWTDGPEFKGMALDGADEAR